MPKRYKMLFSEQVPTQHFISFWRMAKLLITLYSILGKNKGLFGVGKRKKIIILQKIFDYLVNSGSQIRKDVL